MKICSLFFTNIYKFYHAFLSLWGVNHCGLYPSLCQSYFLHNQFPFVDASNVVERTCVRSEDNSIYKNQPSKLCGEENVQ